MSSRSLDDPSPRISKRTAGDGHSILQRDHRICSDGLDRAIRPATNVGKSASVENHCAAVCGFERTCISHATCPWLDDHRILTQSFGGVDCSLIRERQETATDVTCTLNRLLVRQYFGTGGVADDEIGGIVAHGHGACSAQHHITADL